jgi:hypothetical protein
MSEATEVKQRWVADGYVVEPFNGLGHDIAVTRPDVVWTFNPDDEVCKANARLAAAAPDLLAALEALVEEVWPAEMRADPNFAPVEGSSASGAVSAETILDALAAIAKARGAQ